VKGPAGFMLANAEPGGLVNTVTKQPTRERINEISLGMGSFNMMRAAIDLGGEVQRNGKLTYRLNTGMQQNAQFYKLSNFNRFFVAAALKYEFTPNSSLTIEHNHVKAITAHNSFNQITINGEFFKLPIDMAMNDPNIGNFMGKDVYTRAFFQHKINDNWKLNAQAAYMTTDWDGNALYVNGISATKDTIYRDNSMSDWWGKLYNMQLFMDGSFHTGNQIEHKVLVGLDYGNGGEGSTYGGTWGENKFKLAIANPTYYLPKDSLQFIPSANKGSWISSNKWQALYVQDHIKIAKKVVLTLAGRYTHLVTGQDYNSPDDPDYEIADNAFTPRLGLTYLFSDNFSLYAIYDKSFLPQRGAVFGESRLPPLTGSNKEFGVKALFFDKKLSVNASTYSIEKNNVGTSDPIHEGFYLKTGQITSKGIEIDVMGNIGKNLFINANYAFTDAKVTKDRDSSVVGIRNFGTPDHTANAWLKYRIAEGPLKGLSFGGGMQHMGSRSGVYVGWGSEFGNMNLPGYTIYDATVSYTLHKFSVGVNVYNITNKKYASNGYYSPDAKEWLYSPGAPLNFRIQTNIRF
jgi:iron complex outermembrane receptor protein